MAHPFLHLDGHGDDDPPVSELEALYDELRDCDEEHTDVTVTNEDLGCALSAFSEGKLVFEHYKTGERKHMGRVDREAVLRMWRMLVEGDLVALDSFAWISGYNCEMC